MKRNYYILIAMLMVCFTPLSMTAFGTSPTGTFETEKRPMLGCDGVTVTGGSGSISLTGLGSYSHIQVFTPDFASQVFDREITTATLTIPVTTAGSYIVKVWSNPNPGEFCENNFPVTVVGGGGGSTLTLNGCNNASATAAVGATTAIVTYTMPTATTTCATGGATVTRTSGGASGTAFPIGTSQVCFSATDACGNTKTCCITITVTATAGCSNVTNGGTISKACNNGVITLLGTAPVGGSGALEYQWLSATGACPTSTTQAIAGATNATLVVNSASVTATTYYVRCVRRAGCSDVNSWEPGESNCISIAAGECPTTGGGGICASPAANIVAGSGSITITGIASGCSMIQVFNSSWTSVYNQQVNGTTVNVPSLPAGGYIVKVTVLGAGCTWPSLCDVQVTVTVGGVVDPCATDVTPPTIVGCPSTINLTTTGTCANASWTAPTATDNCGTPTIVQVLGGANGSCFPVGTTLVKYMATDAKGNTAICVFNVVVTRVVVDSCATDVTPPTIVCPANIVKIPTDGGTCWTINYTTPTATDNCGTPTVTRTAGPASGSCIGYGVTTVTYKATDAKGNSATCSFTITINRPIDSCATDVTPPTIVCPASIVKTPTDGGTCWTINYTTPTATDNCGTPTVTRTAGPASGSCIGYGVTTVTYKATDAKGNSATCSFTITINRPIDSCATDVTPPTIVCPANIVKTPTDGGTCWTINYTTPTATDNCGTPTVTRTAGPASGSCIGYGVTTVTYKATDAKGNSATCSFTITINRPIDPCATDVTPPTIVCPANIVKTPTSAGSCWAVSWSTPTATDNCGTPTVTQTAGPTNGSCIAPGTYTVTYKATDAKGNSATCSFTVQVKTYLNCNSVTGNTIAKTCVNNIPNLTGSALAGYEYVWLKSTSSCPSQTSQAIAGATGQHYTLPGRVTATTYFVRCARPIGCTTWGAINESNCITVTVSDCAPVCAVNFSATKCYKIVNKRSGKVLDVYAGSCNNDTKITQYGYHGGTNQQWRLTSIGSGYYKLAARNCGKVLACHDTYDGANTYQYDYFTGGAKDWKIECATGGYYRITHRLSGKVLDIEGDSQNDGAAAEIRNHDGSDSQLWEIVEVTCNTSSQHLASNDILETNAAAELSRTRLEWLNNTGYKNDFFSVEKMNLVGDFETLETVNNKYSSETNEHYVTYDQTPTEGDNVYRVKVTYMDGSTKISAPQTVNFKGLEGVRLFPNPANDVVGVDLSKYKGQAVTIALYNQFGQQVWAQQVEKATGTVTLDISQNQAGNYLIRVVSKGRKDVTKQLHIAK